ncbi:hypothetical protein [Collimonas humicola]|uniref:hypothetical protein n=1 Tax=Collimonas humicola TaxID=2825886 RepID=UPI001B8AFEEC|nr:hypothetical protein [Collimonas humicola]
MTYVLVDSKGVAFDAIQADQEKGMFFRRTVKDGSSSNFRLPEFDRMIKQHNFTYQLLDDSLISTPKGDYFVLESMRSIASNPEEDVDYRKHSQWWTHRCAHAVHLTYLVGVVKEKIKIIKNNFTQCTSESRVFKSNGQIGYEVKDYSKGGDQPQSVLYLLQDGKFIRKENGPYKKEPQ